ncbi:aspartyl/asparaginyl beta-hydroxylase domain-containing protein [Nocardia sp. NBC_00416]|uniref:aspartyl/asparaginyl beta-hydroxylase domain-containing protein n=1 Tax=Nocardia sp. NBC_00416 TaxID=2975991 RepID=UPI002E1FE04D
MNATLFALSDLPLRLVNAVLDLHVGGRRREVFFDIDKTYPALREIDRNADAISAELVPLLSDWEGLPEYHDVDAAQRPISSATPHRWKVFLLYAMGEKPAGNRQRCPQTCAVIDGMPDLFQAFFSFLEGGKSIPAHCGPYRGYLRYHLPLVVPARNPPSIRVKDVTHTWRERESILFDDSWEHEVHNDADELRVVLIVDVLRPLPLPFHALNRLVSVFIRYLYGRGLVQNLR